jgi:hypothetical protein
MVLPTVVANKSITVSLRLSASNRRVKLELITCPQCSVEEVRLAKSKVSR